MQISRFFLVGCLPALLVACAMDEGDLEEETEAVVVTSDMDAETVAALYPGCRLDVNSSQGGGKAFGRTSIYCDRTRSIFVAANLYKSGGLICWDTSTCDSTSCSAQCSVVNPTGSQTWCALGWGDVEGVDMGEKRVCHSF